MKKTKDPALFAAITNFMKVYSPVVRRKSPNTVKSYADAINVYLDFLEETQKKDFFSVSSSDFNKDNIVAFMGWMQTNRGNVATTINQRLAHLRTFCNYLMKNDLLSFDELSKINDIATIDDLRREEFIFLSTDDVRLVLQQPDTSKKTGVRDRFFLALLYDSGCRDQEILDLRIKDFKSDNPEAAEINVIGKGNKQRTTPISSDVVDIYRRYCIAYGIDPKQQSEEYIFTTRNTRHGGKVTKMSPDNTQRILAKYEEQIKKIQPDFPHLHAHLFRRSRAMHLYMAGVDRTLIAEWLGHADLETVEKYARATVDMKRKAAATLSDGDNSVFGKDVAFKYADNKDAMKRLCGLR